MNKFARWAIAHPWLKLVALALAIAAWFYVSSEISKFNY